MTDDLRAVRGITLGLILSILLWCVILLAVWRG